jgi:hypothetical protein
MGKVFLTRREAEMYRYLLPLPGRWETIHFSSNKGREGFVIRRKPLVWQPVKEVTNVGRNRT